MTVAARRISNSSKAQTPIAPEESSCPGQDVVCDERLHESGLSTETETSSSLNTLVGLKARQLREERGLSLRKAAVLASSNGVSIQASRLMEMERGERTWSTRMIEAVAAVYQVPPLALLDVATGPRLEVALPTKAAPPESDELDEAAPEPEVRGGSDDGEERTSKLNLEVSKQAKLLRLERGLSLRKAATLASERGVGLQAGRLLEMERGERMWSIRMLEVMADVYDVPPIALFNVSNDTIDLMAAWIKSGVHGVIEWAAQRLDAASQK